MKKWILGLLLLAFSAISSWAQVYTVTGQATDSDGQQWIGGSYQIKLINPNGMIPPNYSCSTTGKSFPANFLGTLDSSGQFSVQLTSTACIIPKGLLWQFTICPNVTGAACGTIQIPITQAGSITGQIAPSLLAPRVTGGPGIHAYNDTEVAAFSPNTYFNVITQQNRCFSTAWGLCAGNGSLPSASAAGQGPISLGAGVNYGIKDLFAPVLNASAPDVAGADIGAKVNTLYAQLSTASKLGTVTLDPTAANGNQFTTINVPLGDTLDCQGAVLNYATTGYQIIYGSLFIGGTQALQGQIRNCNLTGNSQSATAIYSGGDPNGVITPSGNFGNNLTLYNNVIKGYGTGYTHGSNSYNNLILDTTIYDNANDIVSAPTNATNDGEATMVIGSVIANATVNGFNMNNVGDVYYVDTSHCDYNIQGCVGGTGANIEFNNAWEEAYMMPIVNLTGNANASIVKIRGGQLVATGATYQVSNIVVASNVVTITTTAAVVGYWTGYQVQFNGMTNATGLNGTTAIITGYSNVGSVGTITATTTYGGSYNTADSGYVHPNGDSIWHVEGSGSFVSVDTVTINAPGSENGGPLVWPANAAVGVGSTTGNTVCVHDNYQGHAFTVAGTTAGGCLQFSSLQMQVGPSKASISPTAFYQTTAQGMSFAWNVGLSGLTGELDEINVRGSGSGGLVFCDGPFGYNPKTSTCQFSINGTTGEVFIPSLTPSEIVFTDSSKGLISGTALPAGTTGTTASPGDNTSLVATNAFVQAAIGGLPGSPVTSVFTRTGGVTAQSGDYTVSQVTGAAPTASPAFTGVPTVPTASPGTNTTQAASTAFVAAAIPTVPVSSVFTRTGAVVATSGDYTISQITGGAPLASPAFTGTPTGPTQAISTNNTDLATTAAVFAALGGATTPVSSVFGRTGAVVATSGDYAASQVTNAAATNVVNTFSGAQTAPGWFPVSITSGPTFTFFDDFVTSVNGGGTGLGTSPSGNSLSYTTTVVNGHPGVVSLISGTVSGTGEGLVNNGAIPMIANLSTDTVPFIAEALLQPSVLPGTTASVYQWGVFHNPASLVTPLATGVGFALSSGNANANHWYCNNEGALTDSGVSATVAFHRLSLQSNGTNVSYYIDGVSVCSPAAISGLVASTASLMGASITLTGSTSVRLDIDYWDFMYTSGLGR